MRMRERGAGADEGDRVVPGTAGLSGQNGCHCISLSIRKTTTTGGDR
jgi:hypothetical protein